VANWLLGDVSRLMNDSNLDFDSESLKLTPASLASLLALLGGGKITGAAAKEVLREAFDTGVEPEAIVEAKGLGTIQDDSVVTDAVAKVIEANPKAVADYKAGKLEAVKFLTGQVMRETRGRANAADVQTALTTALDSA